MILRALLLLAALALAACGAVPQPFRGTPKVTRDNPLIDVPAAMGVEILPITGVSPEMSQRLGRAVAEQLLTLEIPAEAVPRAGNLGFSLFGRAGASVTSPGGEQFDIAWSLRSRRGTIVSEFSQTVQVPPENGPIAAARATSEQIAVAMGLSDTPGVPPPAAGTYATTKPALPSISVKPVEGAPGDGKESLRLAVLQALTDGGLRRDDVNPDITVTCRIELTPQDFATQHVVITWRALLKDGRELGVLHLENVLPNGALDGSWGPTAFAIAAAAQPNLIKLITTQTAP